MSAVTSHMTKKNYSNFVVFLFFLRLRVFSTEAWLVDPTVSHNDTSKTQFYQEQWLNTNKMDAFLSLFRFQLCSNMCVCVT